MMRDSINTLLKELKEYAQKHYIPIIAEDTKNLLELLISLSSPKRILEIGTAIGYSAIVFAAAYEGSHITTIELDEDRYLLARKNINAAGLSQRIHLIWDDAARVLGMLDKPYDLIFLDAAKGQYKEWYPLIEPLLPPGGLLISDNVLYKGLVSAEGQAPRKMRTIANNLREYLTMITEKENLITSVLPVGDGVSISYRKA